jgi:K+-transporting ATPase ATPase C chain
MTTLLYQSLRLTLVFTALVGLAYPLFVTGVAQLAFPRQANGSLERRNGQVVGSSLLAQQFTGPRYFWPRPSAGSYATVPSGASNLGPTSQALQSNVADRVAAFRTGNNLSSDAVVPGDMAFASGSGLDPHISPAAAHLQAARVAAARGWPAERVETLMTKFIEPPQGGFLGEPRVNVLLLNLALNDMDTTR